MTLQKVRLYSEQEALVEVDAPKDASLDDLRRLALEAIDDGEAEFVAVAGWAERGWEGSLQP